MAAMRKLPTNRVLAIGAVALAIAAGGGAAVAGAAGAGSPSGFMDSVAKHLGISRDKLDEATKAAAKDQVDADLDAGRITQAQADALKKRIDAGAAPFLGGGPKGVRPFGGAAAGPLRGGIHESLAAAAKYLGLTEAELKTQLGNGKSLADVAKAQGKDVAGLQAALLASAKASLDKAVAGEDLTQKVADDIYSHLKDRIADIVNGKPGERPRVTRDHDRGGPPPGPGWFGP